MAKFVINERRDNRWNVEADSYSVEDGFVHFVDVDGEKVLTLPVGMIQSVERKDA